MFRVLLAVLGGFVIFLIVHALHFHYFTPYDRVDSVKAAAVFGYLFFYPLMRILPAEEVLVAKLKLPADLLRRIMPAVMGTLLFALMFVGYLVFYFTADRSITFRMLRITDESPTQSITAPEMLAIYDTQGIIIRRFDDLVYGGYFKKENEHYTLTPKGKFILSIYRTTIDFMHMPKF